MKQSKLPILIAIGALLVLGLFLTLYFVTKDTSNDSASSYQECVDQGNEIQLSHPGRCTDKAGNTFMEPVDNTKQTTDDSEQTADNAKPSSENNKKEAVTVTIHFAKKPQSDSDFSYTTPVNRSSERTDIGSYAIEQLIAGPNAEEAARGLYSPLRGKLSGESNCSGKDFSLSIADKVATLKFCKTAQSGGIGDDSRIYATVEDTLKQFSTVEKINILTREGNCFGDVSGQNKCLSQ